MQCLKVDGVGPILLPAVYCGFGRYGSQRFPWWHYTVEHPKRGQHGDEPFVLSREIVRAMGLP